MNDLSTSLLLASFEFLPVRPILTFLPASISVGARNIIDGMLHYSPLYGRSYIDI